MAAVNHFARSILIVSIDRLEHSPTGGETFFDFFAVFTVFSVNFFNNKRVHMFEKT